MSEILPHEYYALQAQKFDDARQLICDIKAELPEVDRAHKALQKCLETNDFDDAIAFMALAMAARPEDILSAATDQLHKGHTIREQLGGLVDAASLLPNDSVVKIKVTEVIRRCKELSYGVNKQLEFLCSHF